MNRREFLKISGFTLTSTATAGCQYFERTTPGPRKISGIESSADRPNVRMSGDVVHPLIDGDDQGLISVSVTWKGNREQPFTFGPRIPDSPMYSEESAGLILLSKPLPERRNEETWIPEGQLVRSLDQTTKKLGPSEALSDEFSLWGDPEHVDYIEPGSYSFSGRFHEGTPLDETEGIVQYDLEVTIGRRA